MAENGRKNFKNIEENRSIALGLFRLTAFRQHSGTIQADSIPTAFQMNSLLTQLADELLVQDITEPSAVLGPLSDHDLQAAYDHILEQFALELLIGAHENSDWHDGKLVIAGNRGNIHLLQAAFYAVRLECHRRRGMGRPVPD